MEGGELGFESWGSGSDLPLHCLPLCPRRPACALFRSDCTGHSPCPAHFRALLRIRWADGYKGVWLVKQVKCEELLHLNFSSLSLVGSVGASFQCQSIHHDHICHDDSDKVRSVLMSTVVKMHAALYHWIHVHNSGCRGRSVWLGGHSVEMQGAFLVCCWVVRLCFRKLAGNSRRWAGLLITLPFPYAHSCLCHCTSSFPEQPGWIIFISEQVFPKLITISAICVCFQFEIFSTFQFGLFCSWLYYGFFLYLHFFFFLNSVSKAQFKCWGLRMEPVWFMPKKPGLGLFCFLNQVQTFGILLLLFYL